MQTEIITQNGVSIAVIDSEEILIQDVASALDLAMTVQYQSGCSRLALPKEILTEDFFKLSTCLAGEILQKFINYRIKLAIFGDFSGYTSKPLRDFIYESNQGRDVFFTAQRQEAIDRLAAAKEY